MTDDGAAAARRADFERRAAVQGDYLRDQLGGMRRRPALWRKYRLLEVRCGSCGSMLVEIINTDVYAVMLYHASETTPSRIDGRTHTRRGELTMHPLQKPIPAIGDEATRINCACSCSGDWNLTEAYVLGLVSSGVRKKVLHQRR